MIIMNDDNDNYDDEINDNNFDVKDDDITTTAIVIWMVMRK